MQIEVFEGGRRATTYRFFGIFQTTYTMINPGRWVRADGTWASRDLALRIEEVVEATRVNAQQRHESNLMLHGTDAP